MYLLKVAPKPNGTNAVTIRSKHTYHEFSNFKNIIDWVYANAMFIDSYELFEIKPMNEGESQNQIHLSARRGEAFFN